MQRKPDYENGRFFISPILGCNARCSFCYIYSKGYEAKISINEFGLEETIIFLQANDKFKAGVNGSIISIGAWGDPFPRYSKRSCIHTLEWLGELAKLKNPIQIMSRYELSDEIVEAIVKCNFYTGQILYSTSLSTLHMSKEIEPYADNPELRLESIKKLREKGVFTNVMIKPFLSGVTDLEINSFIEAFNKFGVEYCVVGDLLVDKRIKTQLVNLTSTVFKVEVNGDRQVLDCTSGESYEINISRKMLEFSSLLEKSGIKAFRKSSCVNSYILNIQNPANYINVDPHGYCIKCGVCEKQKIKSDS
ncbi:radical SAM protein [Aeromonas rivipollensis]|uniref:radical SAM protein n=1 Tax=Aeromonas rivipollensis TaxID=948519 RepID=UPI00259EBD39|nr:radical SAM protein [Aeromonas rivipollensis]MDM5122780.1 radical SAM protein [Aeromonas rivipollensis]